MNYAFDVKFIYRFKNSLVLKQIASKWNINSKIILQLCAIKSRLQNKLAYLLILRKILEITYIN